MNEVFAIEYVHDHNDGDYDSYRTVEILTEEGVFTHREDAKTRCSDLVIDKYRELKHIASEDKELGGKEDAEIEINGHETYQTRYDQDAYSWTVVPVTVH